MPFIPGVVVDHLTATVWELWIGQQFGTAAVGPNIQVLQPQREGQGVSDRRIIVDDKDTVSVRLCASSSAKRGGRSGWLSGFAKSAFLVLLEILHVEVAVGFQPVLVRLDRQSPHQPAA